MVPDLRASSRCSAALGLLINAFSTVVTQDLAQFEPGLESSTVWRRLLGVGYPGCETERVGCTRVRQGMKKGHEVTDFCNRERSRLSRL